MTLQEQVSEFYERLWRDISAVSLHDIVQQFLRNVDLSGDWFKNRICVDVGCGSGYNTWVMQHLGAICYACDLSHRSPLHVREKLTGHSDDVFFVTASALELPYPSDTFDFVYCNGVLHHTINPEHGFSELARITRQGGVLFLSVYGKGGLYNALLKSARAFIRHTIPYSLADRVADLIFFDLRVPTSFMPAKISALDNLYVPIRKTYLEDEIREWFLANGFDESSIVRTKTTIYNHEKWINRLIHGEGYLQFRGRKSTQESRSSIGER